MTSTLTDDEIDDRFYVFGEKQIIATLGQFIYQSIPVSVLFDEGKDFILTTLLEARPESLIFDLGGDARANQRLLKSASCVFVTAVNGIRVQFSSSGHVKQVRWGDADALAIKLPTRVLRLQRREAYRIATPVVNFVAAQLQIIQHGVACSERAPIHNVSVFGFCALFSRRPDLEPGQPIVRILFTLPERHVIEGEGVVRHVTEFPDASGKPTYRVGVAFKDLPRSMEIAIQRYIIELEHARRSMSLD